MYFIFLLLGSFTFRKKGKITVAAGRLQGQHDAMAATFISNLISSLLLHLSLLVLKLGKF